LLVYDDEMILSTELLRFENEIVRHTTLDAIGDLYTAGYRIIGKYETSKGGHYYNNLMLKKLFESPENFEIV
jgi:UDP-3-O-[3-hydroxymyristoyl] N-acetylglucosamine deacetylase